MNLYYNTVSPLLKEALHKISENPLFKDFILVGGTCLSLQLGHRRSIDIDLFTDVDYGTMDTKNIKHFLERNFPYTENIESLVQSSLGYNLFIGNSPADKVKVDFFYTEKFIFPIKEIDKIRMADIREIAAMKIGAIAQEEPRQKDFWDIHELKDSFSFKDMLNWVIKRNEWAVSEDGVLQGFQKIDSVKESREGIDCLRGKYWSLVKDDLLEMVDDHIKDKEFLTAVEHGDIVQLTKMKDTGFSPSPYQVEEAKRHAPVQTVIALQKIFDLPPAWMT